MEARKEGPAKKETRGFVSQRYLDVDAALGAVINVNEPPFSAAI